jgi:dihydrofolate synthase/folylpolyglutamate synthase
MNELTSRLNTLVNNERSGGTSLRDYSLRAIRRLLKHYGDPHRGIDTVHIAGTNGKGSVAHMLQGILHASGHSTGLYTSPHLVKINERIIIGRERISEKTLLEYIRDLMDAAKALGIVPTYFDALTVAAFRYFHDQKVDLAVIETGLGGRLDSTNVVSPRVSILTEISMDHTHLLGGTLAEISAEKAGIIKRGSPVIAMSAGRIPRAVISARAGRCHSPLYFLDRDIKVSHARSTDDQRTCFSVAFRNTSLESLCVPLYGIFQARNAAAATACAMLLKDYGFSATEKSIRKGLLRSRVPGRFAILREEPAVVFDPAHNLAAVKSLVGSLNSRYPGKRFIAIASIMKDKDYPAMLTYLLNHLTPDVLYFELPDDRCFAPSAATWPKRYHQLDRIKTFADTAELADALRSSSGRGTVIAVTGSFRLYSIARKIAAAVKGDRRK